VTAPARKSTSAAADRHGKISGKDYDKELRKLHVELVKLQQWVVHKGLKVCIVFEGRDGAGKGGTIKAITERVSPRFSASSRSRRRPSARSRRCTRSATCRTCRPRRDRDLRPQLVQPRRCRARDGLSAPTSRQGFSEGRPAVREADGQLRRHPAQILARGEPGEQTRRLEARVDDGRKTWKLSPMDIKSYTRWDDYSKARDDMFAETDTPWAPWFVARSDDKRRARLNIISHLLSRVPYESPPREK
jgi:polyphosphate kinase 2 (PPK2 family)